MAAAAWVLYNKAKLDILKGDIDLDGHDIKVALFSSAYSPLVADEGYADISANEIAAAYGYEAGGKSLTNKVVSVHDTTAGKFRSDAISWIAAGGAIAARYAVMYDNSHVDKTLICYSLLDTTPADVTAADTTALVITPHADGFFYAR